MFTKPSWPGQPLFPLLWFSKLDSLLFFERAKLVSIMGENTDIENLAFTVDNNLTEFG